MDPTATEFRPPEGHDGAAPPIPPIPHSGASGSRGGGAGITAGLIFIAVGVLLLLMRFTPGVAWWSLWPVVIVIAGLVKAITPGREGRSVMRAFDGLETVAFGLVLLAFTTGVIGWGVWWNLLSLWPVLLVCAGLAILGHATRALWPRILASVLVIGTLGYAAVSAEGAATMPRLMFTAGGEEFSLSAGSVDTREATLRVEGGLARIDLTGGADGLVEAEGTSPWGEPDLTVDKDGDATEVRLSLGDGVSVFPGTHTAEMDVALAEDVLWDIDIATGMSSVDADLSDLSVRALTLKPGAADCVVRLGDVPSSVARARVDVRAGVSSVVVRVPSDAEVRLVSDSGLSSVDVDSGLEKVSRGRWETPGFARAAEREDPVWVIDVRSGVGSFELERY